MKLRQAIKVLNKESQQIMYYRESTFKRASNRTPWNIYKVYFDRVMKRALEDQTQTQTQKQKEKNVMKTLPIGTIVNSNYPISNSPSQYQLVKITHGKYGFVPISPKETAVFREDAFLRSDLNKETFTYEDIVYMLGTCIRYWKLQDGTMIDNYFCPTFESLEHGKKFYLDNVPFIKTKYASETVVINLLTFEIVHGSHFKNNKDIKVE